MISDPSLSFGRKGYRDCTAAPSPRHRNSLNVPLTQRVQNLALPLLSTSKYRSLMIHVNVPHGGGRVAMFI